MEVSCSEGDVEWRETPEAAEEWARCIPRSDEGELGTRTETGGECRSDTRGDKIKPSGHFTREEGRGRSERSH